MRLQAKQAELQANESVERIKSQTDIMTTKMTNEKDILVADGKMTTEDKMAELKRLNMQLEADMKARQLAEEERSNKANEDIKRNQAANKPKNT